MELVVICRWGGKSRVATYTLEQPSLGEMVEYFPQPDSVEYVLLYASREG